jgi:hypothetical protein
MRFLQDLSGNEPNSTQAQFLPWSAPYSVLCLHYLRPPLKLSYPYSSFLSSSSFLGSKLSCTISDILVCGGAFTYSITVIELILIESILVSQGSDIDIWG